MPDIDVLLIGDFDHAEFHEPLAWLRARTRLRLASTCGDGLRLLADTPQSSPAALILAQPRPGCLSRSEVEQLHRAAPLARLIGLLGSWCEGEPRSGRPWPGVIRVYWHQFVARAAREWSAECAAGEWQLPRTATDTDRLLTLATPREPRSDGLVAVRASNIDVYEGLAAALRLGGWATIWEPPRQTVRSTGLRGRLWDFWSLDATSLAELQATARSSPALPIVALVGFPRAADLPLLRQAGATAVISKPFLVDDLLFQLQTCLSQARSTRHAA